MYVFYCFVLDKITYIISNGGLLQENKSNCLQHREIMLYTLAFQTILLMGEM